MLVLMQSRRNEHHTVFIKETSATIPLWRASTLLKWHFNTYYNGTGARFTVADQRNLVGIRELPEKKYEHGIRGSRNEGNGVNFTARVQQEEVAQTR